MHPETSTSFGRGELGRRTAVLGTVAALTAASLLTAGNADATAATRTGSVHPQLGVLQCLGTESGTYNPGVIFQGRQFTVTTAGQFGSCVDGAGAVVRRRFTAVAADSPAAVLLCQGTETVSYNPPLTYTPKLTDVSGTEDLDNCPIGGVTAGSASGGYQGTLSCTSLRLLTVSSSTYTWNSGLKSVVTYTTTAIERLLDGSVLVTEQGAVTSGFDQGRAAAYQIILPQLDPTACLGAGVGRLAGPEVLTFS